MECTSMAHDQGRSGGVDTLGFEPKAFQMIGPLTDGRGTCRADSRPRWPELDPDVLPD